MMQNKATTHHWADVGLQSANAEPIWKQHRANDAKEGKNSSLSRYWADEFADVEPPLGGGAGAICQEGFHPMKRPIAKIFPIKKQKVVNIFTI